MKELSIHDQAVVQDILQGGRALDERLREIYLNDRLWQQVWGFVRKRGGEKEDAEDILQDAIRILILNVRQGKSPLRGTIEQYLLGICRNLWFGRFREKEKQAKLREGASDEEQIEFGTPESLLISDDQQAQLQELLGQLSEACREVLLQWQMGYSMKEIAAKVGYKSEGVARKKKHQCLNRLIQLLEEQPSWKTILDQSI